MKNINKAEANAGSIEQKRPRIIWKISVGKTSYGESFKVLLLPPSLTAGNLWCLALNTLGEDVGKAMRGNGRKERYDIASDYT